MIHKVSGYLIRLQNNFPELLVFDHLDYPEAGRQVPGGTIEPGESEEEAILREFAEETGLSNLQILYRLATIVFVHKHKKEEQRKTVFLLRSVTPLPDQWIHIVQSEGEDDALRFSCYWVGVERADLIYDQGDFLKHIPDEYLTIL